MIGLIAGLAILQPGPDMNVLVFSKTAAFRHDSIETGQAMFKDLAAKHGFRVATTEDASEFRPYNLAKFNVVVFLSTTGDVLNDSQQAAFEKFIEGGGGYVGIHAAADTEYDWPWYGNLVGAWFKIHPRIQEATVVNEDPGSPMMKPWPAPQFKRTDEWYDYRTNPRSKVHVLASLVKSSYEGSQMDGDDHPITWDHEVGKGRAFYTAFGHTKETYADPRYQEMIYQALLWASRK
jgi:type 1 glutamine amidotransferase